MMGSFTEELLRDSFSVTATLTVQGQVSCGIQRLCCLKSVFWGKMREMLCIVECSLNTYIHATSFSCLIGRKDHIFWSQIFPGTSANVLISPGTWVFSIEPILYVWRTQFGLVSFTTLPHGIHSGLFFNQLKHDPNTHLISNMGGLGQRPTVHQSSWSVTIGTLSILYKVNGK